MLLFICIDPRTKEWFLVPSIYSPLSACLLYVLVVNLGPRFMEKRQPLELKIPMALYNFGATALNVYCFSEVYSVFIIKLLSNIQYHAQITI